MIKYFSVNFVFHIIGKPENFLFHPSVCSTGYAKKLLSIPNSLFSDLGSKKRFFFTISFDDVSRLSEEFILHCLNDGRRITLFLNEEVMEGNYKDIPLSIINTILNKESVYFNSKKYKAENLEKKYRLSRMILSKIKKSENPDYVESFFLDNKTEKVLMEPLSKEFIKNILHYKNLRIGSHGSKHLRINDEKEFLINLNGGQKYIQEQFNYDAKICALPFGFSPINENRLASLVDFKIALYNKKFGNTSKIINRIPYRGLKIF